MALKRRQFLQAGMVGLAAAVLPSTGQSETTPVRTLRIALLHLAPLPAT